MAANTIIFSNGTNTNADIMLTGSMMCHHAVCNTVKMAAVLK